LRVEDRDDAEQVFTSPLLAYRTISRPTSLGAFKASDVM
jgi:hypothetical protein